MAGFLKSVLDEFTGQGQAGSDDPTWFQPVVSVIKNDSYGDILCWQYPREDFNTGAQLIVAEYEQALFVKDGIIEEIFGPGKYTLTTENYPFLTKLVKRFITGGESPFACKIFYINMAHHLELKWGTGNPIHILDPVWGVEVQVQARGAYSIQVMDSKNFYVSMIGAYGAASQDDVVRNFKTAFRQHFTDALADYLTNSNQEILQVLNKKKALADSLIIELNDILAEYGIGLINFYIESIEIPENDATMSRIREMRIKRQEKNFDREQQAADSRLKLGLERETADTNRYVSGQEAQADYERMKIRDQDGNNGWARQEASGILKSAATNKATVGLGTGIGMGVSAGKAVNKMANGFFNGTDINSSLSAPGPANGAPVNICPKCNSVIPNGMSFCGTCGTQFTPPAQQVCAKCGTAIPSGMKFCGACGTPVATANVCKNCGKEVPAGMKFCGICGTPVDAQ